MHKFGNPNNSITEVAKRWPMQPFISHQSIISVLLLNRRWCRWQ